MTLPLINQFYIPLELYSCREANSDDIEMRKNRGEHISHWKLPVKSAIIETLDTADKAVSFLLNAECSKKLENCIENSLNNEKSLYKCARQMMDNKTPDILLSYQNDYPSKINMIDVDKAITTASNNNLLSSDQIVFHGGGILNDLIIGKTLKTERPLSTSLCPVKALLNGINNGKYYYENEVNLIILTVKKIQKPAFIFEINESEKGHEKEILIHSGITLTLNKKLLINPQFTVYKDRLNKKKVPAYLVHASIS